MWIDAWTVTNLRLLLAVKEATEENKVMSQELDRFKQEREAVDAQNFRLEATVNLLIEDYRTAADNYCSAEDAREWY